MAAKTATASLGAAIFALSGHRFIANSIGDGRAAEIVTAGDGHPETGARKLVRASFNRRRQ